MNVNFEIIHVPYNGDNLQFLEIIKTLCNKDLSNCLFRASEKCELWRTLMYGTDRGGYPPQMWQDDVTPFEDVIYATDEEDIRLGEIMQERSSSFKKFNLIDDPLLLIYRKNFFTKVADRQWKFVDQIKSSKIRILTHIVFIDKVYRR